MAHIEHISGVEKLLRELLVIAEVRVDVQASGHYYVAVMPRQRAPLWWYGCDEDLQTALQECRDKAVGLGFIVNLTQDTK